MPKTRTTDSAELATAVFVDHAYTHRTILINGQPLRVVHGRVSTNNPDHIAALDEMYGISREIKKHA